MAIDPKVKERAYELYMEYKTVPEIGAELGVAEKTLKTWITRGKWVDVREGLNRELAKDINRRRAFTWGKITNLSTEIIARYVADVYKKPKVEAKDAYFLSQVLGQLDKAMRLAQGEPTDVVKHEGTVGLAAIAFRTEKEIKEALGNDPMTAIDVDYRRGQTHPKPGIKEITALEGDRQAEVVRERAGEDEDPS